MSTRGHHGLLLASGGGGYTTLDPSNKHSNINLSEGNLRATAGAGTTGIVRSVHPLVGKMYFEAALSSPTTGTGVNAVGVVRSTHSINNSLAQTTDGWGFWETSRGAYHGSLTIGTASTSGVYGFAVDVPGGKMWIRKNGTWMQGDPATDTSPIWTDLSGTLYAAAGPWIGPNSVRMRFDPAEFSNPAPSGFGPVLG